MSRTNPSLTINLIVPILQEKMHDRLEEEGRLLIVNVVLTPPEKSIEGQIVESRFVVILNSLDCISPQWIYQ